MTENATVKILKYDPSMDREPRWETYEVPPEGWEGHKVIDTLRYIYENFDPDLAFREPCRQQLCGACIMLVNRKSILACNSISEKEMVVEPSPKYPVVKDLIVDLSGGSSHD